VIARGVFRPAIRNGVLRLAGKRIFKANNRPLLQDP
jgi:hypothetical protein